MPARKGESATFQIFPMPSVTELFTPIGTGFPIQNTDTALTLGYLRSWEQPAPAGKPQPTRDVTMGIYAKENIVLNR